MRPSRARRRWTRRFLQPTNEESYVLHLYSVANPQDFGQVFSSPAPGFIIGVGSIGRQLAPYEDCDTSILV
ncbi:hypothetical protein EDC04DRAFT_3122868 [Pisolithus marmoratus]|nr:hypothetical protein EDC04DRAFT_3122868 [Pisolithus marmoratus]